MNKKDFQRTRPAGKGEGNDPALRDQTSARPGVSTISSSETDQANEELTRTSADNFREEKKDPRADPALDD